ncbi:MAG: ABC transporter ATP-binding protein [Planctomycetota bacterium]
MNAPPPAAPVMQEALLHFDDVSKFYGPVLGLSEVSFELHGGVVGLLGRNGAGKTTLIRLASGLLEPDLGRVRVCGEAPHWSLAARARTGVCPDIDRFYEGMSGHAWVRHLARLSGLSGRHATTAAATALERVGMADKMRKRIGAYSKGMRQRTKLAAALVHEPRLLLLDEPLTGLDPVGRFEIVQLVRRLGDEGCAVLVSSHVLSEVELMTDQLVLIHQGRLMAEGRVSEIRDQIDDQPRRVAIDVPEPRRLATTLLEREAVEGVEVEQGRLLARFRDGQRFYGTLTAIGGDHGVRGLINLDAGLDAVFDYLVGRA